MRVNSVKVAYRLRTTPKLFEIDPAAVVENILFAPDDRLDYASAKLAFDRLIDPTIDSAATISIIDSMVAIVRQMAGQSDDADAKLSVLRTVVYEPGHWNEYRPFSYDHDDALGQSIFNKLLATYLATRRGNCVSMPILFLILADRLGLNVALATAPLHVFLKYTRADGRVLNLEATSGAHPARAEWYHNNMPMSDRAISSGLYMRALPKREGIALMATTVMDHLMEAGHFAQAVRVSEAILHHAPRDGYTMVKQASACGALMRVEFTKYRTPGLIPPHLRPRYLMLAQRNRAGFATAEALGWEPVA